MEHRVLGPYDVRPFLPPVPAYFVEAREAAIAEHGGDYGVISLPTLGAHAAEAFRDELQRPCKGHPTLAAELFPAVAIVPLPDPRAVTVHVLAAAGPSVLQDASLQITLQGSGRRLRASASPEMHAVLDAELAAANAAYQEWEAALHPVSKSVEALLSHKECK